MQQPPVNNNYKYNEQEEESLISEYLFKYLPYWPLFVLLVLLCSAGAYVYLRYKQPVYEVTANILVKDEKKGIDESSIMESLDMFGSKKIVENEIEVLKSRDLMKQVVTNLHLYAPIYQEGRVHDVSAYVASPVFVEVKDPATLNETPKVKFAYKKATNEVVLNKVAYPLNTWVVLDNDTIKFLPNLKYVAPEVAKPLYFNLVSVKRTVAGLLANVEISPVSKQATVINLKLKDEITVRGEEILNELIRVYNDAAIKDKNKLAANTLAFVEERLKGVTQDLGQVETSIQQYKTQNNIVDISEQGKSFLSSVQNNDQQVAQMNMQLAVLDQVERYVQSRDGNTGIVPSTLGVNDAVLSQLLQTLYDLQLQYEKLKKTTAENNPVLVSVQEQIEKVRPNILENIRNQRNSLTAGKNNLEANSNRYTAMLTTIPRKERELLEISREQAIKNNIYTFLLQKKEETALSFASTVADSRIVDQAEASIFPVSPKKSLVYLIALVAALAAGIGIITVKELLNPNVLFRNEIEKAVSWPIVGEIAFDSGKEAIVVGEGKRNLVAEQFRQIRTTLDYLGINSGHKKILITSSISGEGKSFVAGNLAISLALTGKKVVLLELDLRKPKLSPIFNLDKTKDGITNYLIGKSGIAAIIQKTEANPNLYFIPSGPIPPNPSELILNGRMHELLEFLDTQFDYILIDTAPVAPVTDAHILSKSCDATLYIVRHDYTPKVHVKRLEENNKIRGLHNVAIIFNGLKERGFGKYGGYGYGYGYGYGEVDEEHGSTKKAFSRFLNFLNL